MPNRIIRLRTVLDRARPHRPQQLHPLSQNLGDRAFRELIEDAVVPELFGRLDLDGHADIADHKMVPIALTGP